MMEKLRHFATHPFIVLLVGAVGATGGFFAGDFFSWRSEARATERAAFEQTQAVTDDLQSILIQFAQIADGSKPKSKPDLENLRKVLLKDQKTAETLVRLEPSAEPLLKKFEKSAIAVLANAERLDGPLTAKPMAEAVSDYPYARGELHSAVADSFSKYL